MGILSGSIRLRNSEEEPELEQELLERRLHQLVDHRDFLQREQQGSIHELKEKRGQLEMLQREQQEQREQLNMLRLEQHERRRLLEHTQALLELLELHPERPIEQHEWYRDLDAELQLKLRELQELQKRLLHAKLDLRDQVSRELQEQRKLLALRALRTHGT